VKIDKNFLNKVAFGFLTLGLAGVLYSSYFLVHQVEFKRSAQLAALMGGQNKEIFLGKQIKFSDCQARGPLPDPDCTPGAVFTEATKEEICVSGYSKKVRNVSQKLKKKAFEIYGIDYPVPFGSYEIDHLIPLSLGGNNDISNLWPKSAEPFPGFFEKNVTGNYLREEVCDGRIALTIAQEQIARDWFIIYRNIDPKIIKDLKDKYPNWADIQKR
jgi:hypothetical protein